MDTSELVRRLVDEEVGLATVDAATIREVADALERLEQELEKATKERDEYAELLRKSGDLVL